VKECGPGRFDRKFRRLWVSQVISRGVIRFYSRLSCRFSLERNERRFVDVSLRRTYYSTLSRTSTSENMSTLHGRNPGRRIGPRFNENCRTRLPAVELETQKTVLAVRAGARSVARLIEEAGARAADSEPEMLINTTPDGSLRSERTQFGEREHRHTADRLFRLSPVETARPKPTRAKEHCAIAPRSTQGCSRSRSAVLHRDGGSKFGRTIRRSTWTFAAFQERS